MTGGLAPPMLPGHASRCKDKARGGP